MARKVADIALLLGVMSGPDDRSPISLPEEKKEFLAAVKNPSIRGFKVAWGGNLNLTPVDHEVQEITKSAIKVFRGLGCEIEEEAPDFSGVKETAILYRGLRYICLYLGGMHPFPAIGYGLIVSIGLHVIINPFTKPESEEHLNRIFGKIPTR
jgi:Asp-tRNA(Asn)/Glu-tRNA(Gln) amidotransferase A subunit family amidase